MLTRLLRPPGVHLLIFCSEGPPADQGKNSLAGARELIRAAGAVFTSVRVHTPRSLISMGEHWEEKVSDVTEQIRNDKRFTDAVKWNPDWARIGLFRWKPSLILQELESSRTKPGDIVFYHDPDAEKYPEYLRGVERWPRWLRARMRSLDVLAFDDNHAPVSSDVKPELLVQYLPGADLARFQHIWAGAMAVRKTDAGVSFAKTWSEHTSLEAVSPFTASPTPQGFNWNSCDQAVLTALWNSERYFGQDISRDVQYLYRSRVIPPPSRMQQEWKKTSRRLTAMVQGKKPGKVGY